MENGRWQPLTLQILLPREAPQELVVTQGTRDGRERVYQLSLKPVEKGALC
jgi:hypothetical protein